VQKIINNSGVYLLEIFASEPFKIKSKPFCNFQFPAGYYYYAGSAQKNLLNRIERHLRKEKILHWHIDHITSLTINIIVGIFIFNLAPKKSECELVNHISKKYKVTHLVSNFGSSDCRNCFSHLLYSKNKLHFNRKGFGMQPIVFVPGKFPR
jgi:Uri superfamily endonuclease